MSNNNNILPNFSSVTDEQMLNYLKGNLSPEELHEIEKLMVESDFVNDAVEGLQNFDSDTKMEAYVKQLNTQLHQQLSDRKAKKEKRSIKNMQWTLIAVVIVLLLCLLGYAVITLYQRTH